MPIHLRQICLVAKKLEPCLKDIETAFQIPICHRDPEVATFGLENALFAFGSQFLEVVSPVQSGTAAGRFLERRGGDGGYMVICQAPTLEEQARLRQRAEENRVRVAYEADRGSWNILQLHPRDMGAAFLEVDWDEQADMRGNWQPAGGLAWTDSARADAVQAITAVTLASSHPERLADHWSGILGESVYADRGHPSIRLANATLRFTKGHTPQEQGLTALDISGPAPLDILDQARARGLPTWAGGFRLCGVTFNCQGLTDD